MVAQDRKGIFRFWETLRASPQGMQNAAAAVQAASHRRDGKQVMNATMPQAKSSEEIAVKLMEAVLGRLTYTIGKDPSSANQRDWFLATAFAVRDRIVDRWIAAPNTGGASTQRRVYYLSLEFLIGRLLMDALNNLGLTEQIRAALWRASMSISTSLARDGARRSARQWRPRTPRGLLHGKHGDAGGRRAWLRHPLRPRPVPAGASRTAGSTNIPRTGWPSAIRGSSHARKSPMPSDLAAPWRRYTTARWRKSGARPRLSRPSPTTRRYPAGAANTVNTLRLWRSHARPIRLRLDVFNAGDYVAAQTDQVRAEVDLQGALSERLDPGRPGASAAPGIFLRLGLAAGPHPPSLKQHGDITKLADKVAIQLNDTHPAIAVAELMRLLVDVYGVGWETVLDHHAGHVLLHEPHAAARSLGDPGRCR